MRSYPGLRVQPPNLRWWCYQSTDGSGAALEALSNPPLQAPLLPSTEDMGQGESQGTCPKKWKKACNNDKRVGQEGIMNHDLAITTEERSQMYRSRSKPQSLILLLLPQTYNPLK